MNHDPAKLEKLLTRVAPAAPPPELRSRVLTAATTQVPRPFWPFIEGLAACLLVGMNLALAVGLPSPTPYRTPQAANPQEAMRQIKAMGLDPELAGIARLGLPEDTVHVAPSLNIRSYQPFTGEL